VYIIIKALNGFLVMKSQHMWVCYVENFISLVCWTLSCLI